MLDIKFVRNNPEAVKENIRKKFQDEKIELVDKVIELDREYREAKGRGDELRALRNSVSKEIGALMAKGQREEAENDDENPNDDVGKGIEELSALSNHDFFPIIVHFAFIRLHLPSIF